MSVNKVILIFLSDLCGREGKDQTAYDYLLFLSDLCGREAQHQS